MQIVFIYHNSYFENLKNNQKKKYNEDLELVAKYINKDTRLKKMAIVTLGSLFYCQSVLATDPTGKINAAGNKVLNIVRSIGYWIAIIACSVEIIKSLMQSDSKTIFKSIMKFALAFGSLYLLPWIFDLIKEVFS